MGGVAGFCGPDIAEKVNSETMVRMVEKMDFRGVEREFFSNGAISLATLKHDYEQGQRLVKNNALPIVVACEGEIYNGPELLASLSNPPVVGENVNAFELIPFLYEEFGDDFASKLNGSFCFALWDPRVQRLLLVRDHLGAHSLFYAVNHKSLSFATTTAALFSGGQISARLDLDSVDRYLASLAISPPDTIFAGVRAVRPGFATIYENGHIKEHPYWRIDQFTEDRQTSPEEFAGRLRDIFQDAVSLRGAYGGQYGALVSGGVDTSAVIAALSEAGYLQGLQGFSIAFDEKAFSDAPLQDIIYNRYKFKSNRIIVRPDAFARGLIQGCAFLDCPVNDVAFSGMYNAFKAAAGEGCNVVFEGEGSDEIFCTGHSRGEYDMQKFLAIPFALRRALFGSFIPMFSEGATFKDKVFRRLARFGMTDLQRRSTWIPVFSKKTRDRLLGRSCSDTHDVYDTARSYYENTQLKDGINVYQYGLTRMFLADDLLYKNERMAAAFGITNRTPFIDYRLVEEGFKVPAEFKLQQATTESDGTKMIFKKAARGLVPDEILDRKKTRGFSQPTALWYHDQLKGFLKEHLLNNNSKISTYLDHKEIHAIGSNFLEGRMSNDYFLNSLLILELWMRKHV